MALLSWAVFTTVAQCLLLPRLFPWPSLPFVLLSLGLYLVLAWLAASFYRSFNVWRSSLASRYEQQCQKLLRSFSLQLYDGSQPLTSAGHASATPVPGQLPEGLAARPGVGFHLGFVRRMPRRLVAFLEAYREEFRTRRGYAGPPFPATKKD